ncbi:MAG: PAS domain S-box protein [Desulfotignum sp.]|nr:PAS domain S-box protein [Desulfotignum sp.]MCF8114082.1 PAS domain S-box protein [Desulfotignum sp.]MCF8125129.1 PAS domain S-box protein [Desulfotignum sp.]
MNKKPTYEALEARILELEQAAGSGPENRDQNIIRTLSESFQQLADLSQDAIYLFDIESGTFPFFNKRFLNLFGGRQAGQTILSSASVAQHIHPEDVHKLRQARKRTLAAGETKGDVEYRYIGSDKTTRWMHDRWSVVRDSKNRAVAIEGFIRDNTQKKQAQEELEHSRNSALIGSYIVQEGRFRYVNPEFCRITGYTGEALTGMLSLDLVHPDYRDHVRDSAKQMLTGQRTTPYEFRVVDCTGRVKWVMETVTSVKHEGTRAVLGYFMDITQQKQMAQEQQDKEKLRAILEMAGAVSHELNNPLQVLSVGIEKLGDPTLEPSKREALIRLVKSHTQRIIELSSKIQKISQYATKDYVQGKKIFDIDAASNEK